MCNEKGRAPKNEVKWEGFRKIMDQSDCLRRSKVEKSDKKTRETKKKVMSPGAPVRGMGAEQDRRITVLSDKLNLKISLDHNFKCCPMDSF